MAAASSIARWLLDEASSGTSTLAADDQSSNDLTIDWSSGDGNWTSVAAGNGLDFTATTNTANTAVAELADISTNGDIGSSLDSVSEVSFIIRCDIDAAHANGMRLFAIGTSSGNTDLSITLSAAAPVITIRWDQESGGVSDNCDFSLNIPSGITTIGFSIDTTETTAADRCKLYLDGSLATPQGGTLTQNSVLDSINATDRSFTLGNRPSQNRNIDGQIFYAELFNGVLTATQHSDAHTALALDNDANWDTPSGAFTLTANTGTYTYTGTAAALTADRILTADSGAYTYTGTAVDLLKGVNLTADSGTYTYSGTDAGLLVDRVLQADSGTYTYTGTSVDLQRGLLLDANAGAYTYTGTDATLTFASAGNFILTADSGAYTYSGTNVELTTDRLLIAESGAYVYTGTAADLTSGFLLQADSGSYAYTGTAVDFVRQRVLSADSGAYVYNGTNANIFFTPVAPDVPVAKGINSSGAFGGGISVSATFGSGIGSKGSL